MLSDVVTTVLKNAAGDVAIIGGSVLLFNAIIWKFKQMTGGLSSRDYRPSVNTRSATGSRSRSRRAGASPASAVLRNADYFEGYRRALAARGVHVTHQQAIVLASYSNKKSLHYHAGYRAGYKAHDVRDYVRMLQKEERAKRTVSVYSEIARSHYDEFDKPAALRRGGGLTNGAGY